MKKVDFRNFVTILMENFGDKEKMKEIWINFSIMTIFMLLMSVAIYKYGKVATIRIIFLWVVQSISSMYTLFNTLIFIRHRGKSYL